MPMAEIVIIQPDTSSIPALRAALKAAKVQDICRIESAFDGADKTYICIGAAPDGLEILENDHFTPPFRIGALLDRVQRHAKERSKNASAAPVEIGNYTLNPLEGLLTCAESGDEIRLTEKEQHILLFLYQNGSQVTDRETLLGEVWGYADSVETHTLETHIYRLRQKIEKDPANPAILLTEDQGYRLA
ncbi:MAG: response regulator transcription factor [Alphaproteobacteria bacterium]|nr:response regulator transcription factor [Alphaproteobacteria bacterium]